MINFQTNVHLLHLSFFFKVYFYFSCVFLPLCIMWQNINIYNFAHRKMSLTLSPFVVVYQNRAYVIPSDGKDEEREWSRECERGREG